MKFRAIDGLLKQLDIMPDVLSTIEATSDEKVAAQASGF